MTYKISTDKAIFAHIEANPEGAILHACVGHKFLKHEQGYVTSCNKNTRHVTLQRLDGSKETYSLDHISIPES